MQNYYLVFEGKTEPLVYRNWLAHLCPNLQEVQQYDQVCQKNYFSVSDMGVPDCYRVVADAIQDINNHPHYSHLILFVDADELNVQEKIEEAHEQIHNLLEAPERPHKSLPNSCELCIIVQKVCLETWFLGNLTFFVRFPEKSPLKEYVQAYDLSLKDPELLEIIPHKDYPSTHSTKAQFHLHYLKKIFEERGISYSKSKPKEVDTPKYLDQLLARLQYLPAQLLSFQYFINFWKHQKL